MKFPVSRRHKKDHTAQSSVPWTAGFLEPRILIRGNAVMEQETPLQALIAKYRYHTDFAELDLTDINQQSYPDDDALLHLVARVGGLDEVELLIASGARVNAIGDMGFTALHYAAMKGHFKMAKKLLDLGANPSIKNEWGETAEVVALYGGHVDLAKLLRHNKYRNMKRNK
jgi:ankyrin repeat protein